MSDMPLKVGDPELALTRKTPATLLNTLKEILEDARANDPSVKLEDYTCFDCSEFNKCPFAFDLYNLGGECLASK